jgi:hypothetical protein
MRRSENQREYHTDGLYNLTATAAARPKSSSTSVVPEAITETARSRVPFYRRGFSRSSFCAVASASFAGTTMSGFTPTPSQLV